jgi:protein SCO1/2
MAAVLVVAALGLLGPRTGRAGTDRPVPGPGARPVVDVDRELSMGGEGRAEPAPPELGGVDVQERPGAVLPPELRFRDEQGRPVRLGDLLGQGLPTILTFNYSNCPMLCSVQLGGLVQALSTMALQPGRQFRIITVGLDPHETPQRAAETRQRYLERLGRPGVASGWHFLVGEQRAIRQLADAVGFRYTYHRERKEYLHPAALVLVTPQGRVSRYVYGVRFDTTRLQAELAAAAMGEFGESLEKFILACYHYISGQGRHTATAQRVMRYAAGGFVLLLLGTFATFWLRRDRSRRAGSY